MTATRSASIGPAAGILYLAFELGWHDWKLAFATGPAEAPRQRTIAARDLSRLREEIAKAKQRFGLPADAPVVSCFEAGRDGFWLDRYLAAQGVTNIVVDAASIELPRRGKRRKTDRLDAAKLVSMLIRHHRGEKNVWRLVQVPCVEDEDRRQLHRDLVEMKAQRTQHTNRIKGLLAGVGLAAYLYGPCRVKAKVASGAEVTIDEQTRYPFAETIELTVTPEKAVRFPLYLRIPAWCQRAELAVNGEQVGGVGRPAPSAGGVKLTPGKLARLEREWQPGDKVALKLPTSLSVTVWSENRGTVSVQRGPLTYSLLIKERYARHGGTGRWPAWDIFPDSPWNYGLVLDPAEPEKTLKVEQGPWPVDDRPFTQDAPVKIRARAKRIPNWTLDRRGLVREVVPGPVKSNAPEEDVTLIPMGAARLRLSAFPLIGSGPDAKDWPAPAVPAVKPSASHCFENDTVDALCDGVLPKNSADHGIERFTWWPHQGTVEWVQYDFPRPRAIDRSEVYWFVDHPRGGCKLPKSWRLLYRDGKEWKPVPEPDGYPLRPDQFCAVHFRTVTTDAVRLEAELKAGFSAGILEWRVSGSGKDGKP
jgi:hypothetical protein